MKKRTLITVLSTTIAFTLLSCKKDSTDNTAQTQDPRLALLTKAVWNKSNEGLDNNKDGVIDVVDGHVLPCNADDRASFLTNGTLTWMEGPTKCNATDPDTYNLSWRFVGSDGINMLDRDLKIFKLTDNELSVYYDYSTTAWQMMQFKR